MDTFRRRVDPKPGDILYFAGGSAFHNDGSWVAVPDGFVTVESYSLKSDGLFSNFVKFVSKDGLRLGAHWSSRNFPPIVEDVMES